MKKKIYISDIIKAKKNSRDQYKKRASLSVSHIEKIKKNFLTKEIKYPEYKDAFDYVHDIFPDAGVKNVSILIAARELLDKLGYSAARGFFNRLKKVVVLPNKEDVHVKNDGSIWNNIVVETTQSETIVHELLHYVSSTLSRPPTSMDMEEEFAYGYSVNYLRMKGHSDDDIINKILMPYLVNNVVDKDKIAKKTLIDNGYDLNEFSLLSDKEREVILDKLSSKKEVYDIIVKEAIEKGKELIKFYSDKIISENCSGKDTGQYNLLDI